MRSFWIRWGAALLGVLSSLALILASLRAQGTIARASEVVVRGELERCTDAVHRALRAAGGPPSDAPLREALAMAAPLGLRYAALVTPEGDILASAGSAAAVPGWAAVQAAVAPGTLLSSGARVRLYDRPLPPPRAPPMPPPFGPPPHPPTPHLVIEVEPAVALALQAESRRTLGLGVLVGLGLMATGAALLLLQRRHEALQDRLTRDQRLAELGQMSAVVAHELRNPLASLKGHAELLLEALEADPVAPQLRPKAARVLHEAERLERLTRDLLEFVRSGAIQRREEDPAAPLQRALQALGAAQGRVQVKLGALPATFPMDGDRMEQVLANLLRNALDSSPPDGTIEASVDLVASALLYTIRDHGPGVPAGQEQRIFEPFYTLRARGTGLGLAVARRIVALHGGDIQVERPAGGGARFRVSLTAESVIKSPGGTHPDRR